MNNGRVGIGIVGCGNICEPYARTMAAFPGLKLTGFTDIDASRAAKMAQRFNARAYPDLDAMLSDPAVDIILNLTIFQAHYAVTRRCLEAGKHVYSEKPLAMKTEEAFELVALAKKRGVRLGCAPANFLGDAQETAWRFLASRVLGEVRVIFAEVNHGRIETWHPAPEPFYEVGPVADVGIYAITLTTAIFGPIRRVQAYSKLLLPHRQTREGKTFTISTPDFFDINFELANGIIFRLNVNFYVDSGERQTGYEIHGDRGSLYLSSEHDYDGSVTFRKFGDETNYQPVPLVRAPFTGPSKVEWSRGLDHFAGSIRSGSACMIQGEQAAHVVEAILAAHESAAAQKPVDLTSTFTPPVLPDHLSN